MNSHRQSGSKNHLDIFISETQIDFSENTLAGSWAQDPPKCDVFSQLTYYLAFPQNGIRTALPKETLLVLGVINRYRTSFSEYKERATMSRSFFVSAWNSCLETEPSNESQTQPINFYFRARWGAGGEKKVYNGKLSHALWSTQTRRSDGDLQWDLP